MRQVTTQEDAAAVERRDGLKLGDRDPSDFLMLQSVRRAELIRKALYWLIPIGLVADAVIWAVQTFVH